MERYVVNQLLNLVSIPSVTGQEGEILFYLEEELTSEEVSFERQRIEGGWYNLLVGDVESPKYVIAAHLDTVPPMDGMPPKPVMEGDFVKGLGACDDKAGVAVMAGLAVEFGDELKDKGVFCLPFLWMKKRREWDPGPLCKRYTVRVPLFLSQQACKFAPLKQDP